MKKLVLLLVVAAVGLMSCQNAKSTNSKKATEAKNNSTVANSNSAPTISLSGAGSTFAGPLYKTAFSKYLAKTDISVSYGLTGSGAGIRSLKDRVVDFCGSDAFLSNADMAKMPGEVVHIPTCSGAVDIAFNLPGIGSIKLTPEVLTQIFMGKINNWNDAELKKLNLGVKFPDLTISVVHRSDGSGTTSIFSDYMSKVSKAWKDQVGTGKSLNWPAGMGAKGNPGVAGTISATKGAIGYIGSDYAFAQKISFALLRNKAGNYIAPSIAAVSAAGKGEMPADTRVMETNSSAPDAYPISGFTWIIIYKNQDYNGRSFEQAQANLKLIDWLLDQQVQTIAKELKYAPLPEKVTKLAKGILRTVNYNGKPIL
ncbi:MAG: phosphate ABC transporter substrate-binding protein PstS [Peptostreptococcaceae bacterium]|nr:phosphate ABC transporter substrate-binding protein PstS [Peptostreptococcaceae bacterium]